MNQRNMIANNLVSATDDRQSMSQSSQDTDHLSKDEVPQDPVTSGWEGCLEPIRNLNYPYFTPLPDFCLYDGKKLRKNRKLMIRSAAVQVHEAWMRLYGLVFIDIDFEDNSRIYTKLLRKCCESLRSKGWAVTFMKADDTSDRTVRDINNFFDRVADFASLYEAAIFLCSGVLMYHYRGQNNNVESMDLRWSCYLEANIWLTMIIDEWKKQVASQTGQQHTPLSINSTPQSLRT